jgi:hypothetical protein
MNRADCAIHQATIAPEAANGIYVSKQDRRLWLHRLTLA